MTALFGDGRHVVDTERRKKKPIVPACGSCSKRVPTILLPVSGLRRCHACAEAIHVRAIEAWWERVEARWDKQGFCEWPRPSAPATQSTVVAPQPSLPVDRAVPSSQPTVFRSSVGQLARDWKIAQGGKVDE